MAYIKSVSRSASVAFSPDSPYLAAGTMAGAVDISFSSTANLEIFKLDFQSSDLELPVVGECPSTERFNRLSWGKTGSGTEEFSLGLIAGGLLDGGINLWNPLTLIRNSSEEKTENALVGRLTKHTGNVRGLDFNPHSPNLLASGADEGEICIWDLANPAEPTHYPPLKSVGSGAQGEVSFLAWNRKIQHILASTSYNGATVVWDLKRQKPVISFVDPDRRRRCSVLQWNPDLPTHLIVASDDDNSPALRLWDLRSMVAPVKEFVGHTKGVIAMSWCPMDSSLLLTCGKDNRTICWDTVSGEIVSEFTEETSWNFDIQWYPKSPGLVSASSFNGKIGIYNIEGCSKLAAGEGQFGAVNLRAPKWMKCPVGASFGFGGKLVSFNPSPSAASTPTGNSEVYLHSLVTEPSLVSRSTEFETAMQDGDKSSLRVLCEKKSEEAKSEDDRETWGFLKVMFEDDGTARTKLLTHLGFSVHDEKVEDNLSEEINALGLDERITNETESTQDKTLSPTDNGEDFFNNLQSPKADPSLLSSVDNFTDQLGSVPSEEQMQQELDGQGEAPSLDDSIRRALVVGDYKGAVSQCISANRMADALVIANLGGASLWESTRDQYLKKSYSSYLKVVSAMVNNDLMSLVNTRPLDSWKETLALLCNFADKEWTVLCDSLASRLMGVGNTLAATLCYICAGNVDKTVEIWSRSLKPEHDGRTYVDLLQDLMEKTIILALATGQKRFSASLSKLVENYAELLASQGLLTTAMEYLKLLGSEESSQELAILQDRIALCAEENGAPKHSPFEHAQPQNESVYGADQQGFDMNSGSQQHYYQSQQHQVTAAAPYAENYQQQYGASYGGAYVTPTPYQPGPPTPYQPGSSAPYQPGSSAPYQPGSSTPYQPGPSTPYQPGPSTPYQPGSSPQMFVPSPEPQVSQPNFPPSVVTQHKTFVPTDLPALRNAQQYQQPSLGSQLYPGAGNNTYQNAPLASGSLGSGPSQMGPVPGHSLSQIAAPAPMSRGFMPVNNTGFAPKPGMGPMQPPSPTQATQAAPASPAAPPPTIQTADTSKVPAQQKPVIATLNRLFKETSEALGGSRANPAKKREIEDNSRKMGALFAKLNSSDISKNAADKLVQLCQALDGGDFSTALQIQVLLTTSEWDECNFWLAALKRMIKSKQNVRLN